MYRRLFFLALALALGIALYRMLDPFWGALSWGFCLAFLLHPLQSRLTRRFKGRENLAAGLITALTPIVLMLPLASLGIVFARQVTQLVDLLRSVDFSANSPWIERLQQIPLIQNVVEFVRANSVVGTADIQGWLVNGAQAMLQKLATTGGNVLLGAVGTLVGFFLMLFLLFFLLRDGPAMLTRAIRLVPLAPAKRDGLLRLMGDTTRAVVYGSGATALAQGTLVGIGFAILGLPSPVVFGALAMICALLPAGGTGIVWLPAAIWLAIVGRWGGAIFMLAWGLVVSLADNFIRPMMIGRHASISTLAVFVGVIGGISAFGAVGLIVGPVLLTLIAALLKFADESLSRDH